MLSHVLHFIIEPAYFIILIQIFILLSFTLFPHFLSFLFYVALQPAGVRQMAASSSSYYFFSLIDSFGVLSSFLLFSISA